MKKLIALVFSVIFITTLVFGQAKKPSIMVVPSYDWCVEHGYITTYDDEGRTIKIADYYRAIENSDLNNVIAKLNEMMNERGYPPIVLKAQLAKIEKDKARTNINGVIKSPIDVLNETAKADILLEAYWKVNNNGPKKSITFRLEGTDSYTMKPAGDASGTGPQSFTAEVAVLLEEAVLSHIDQFNSQLMTHFEDLFANGREGALVVLVDAMSENNLNSMFTLKGREASLKDIINRFWMPRNTVQGRFSMDEDSENVLKFSQVRIPLYGDDGWGGQMAYDFRTWGGNLQQFLKDELGVTSDIQTKGLGEVEIILK